MAKQRTSPAQRPSSGTTTPKPSSASSTRPASSGTRTVAPRSTRSAPAPKSSGISPVTIGLVALVVLALAGFAIFFNQQRNAAPATAVQPGAPPVTMSQKGIPQGVTPEGYPFKGNPDAKVVIEDFSDYQCPHCGTFATVVEPKIEDELIKTGKAKLIFRDFQFLDRQSNGQPNPMGESHRAAHAAHCAKDQGKFWEMHDTLFANQPKTGNKGGFSDTNLEGFAQTIGLNMDQFRACMKNNAGDINKLIERSMNDAKGKQVQGTPTLFINDRKVESGEWDTIKAAVDLAETAK